ncbi:MAG: ATP-binding protein [Thiofilum sp.]|uniref:ATP-binding protein n=1 Tax=Thiofilum sp. TaxID=2212733 RepID=UPI0025FDAE12|nr:ATP-binding protein [Thiofilum sp.]MBK8453934.1 ATP-binding protein [Thiofilum sp.]
MTPRKKLPIGIQTFREIRVNNHYYVDKTAIALELIQRGKYYFLSRPRRFGKSLFLDTLKELFEGNEPLFQGLAVHPQWDWSIQYPVLRFSFGSETFTHPQGLIDALDTQLTQWEQHFSLSPRFKHAGGRFSDLILHLHQKTGKPVVILVDEYDKPILDALHYPEVARQNRDTLRGFYGTIKDYDAHIRFAFLTGVSKFSKVSLFSGLNNLTDITLDERYSTICGYTDHDVDTVFAPELVGLDREHIREWYNGYNWLGQSVYNPYDVLQLFSTRKFKNYWFESGTPTFLVDLLLKRKITSLSLVHSLSSEEMLSKFDIDDIEVDALLFQTGYLTIKGIRQAGDRDFYVLTYPNKEIYQSLNEILLSALVKDRKAQSIQTLRLYDLLLANDFERLRALFQSFFASIPHHWYTHNDIQNYEGYYASVFYSYFASLGLTVIVEDATNLGRIDMTLKFNNQVYLFEFKVIENTEAGSALQQLKDRLYADKYRGLNQPIYLMGVEFSKVSRNVVGFEVEQV